MKKHTFSRVLSMVLCLVLALSAICLPAYAEKRRRGNREARRDNRRRYAAHKGKENLQ